MSAAQNPTLSADLVTKVFTARIRGSVDAVWKEITKTDEVQQVMFNMRLHAELTPGARLQMRSPDGRYTNIVGEMLAFEPKRRYAHTFKFTQFDEPAGRVTHELEQDGDEVVYTMTCEDMVQGDKTTKQTSRAATSSARTSSTSWRQVGSPSVPARCTRCSR